ncbi:hypothetical protein EON67_05505 [archaeon]|nr:MAG: hypothetical protein EON67_05505 [archaeon]
MEARERAEAAAAQRREAEQRAMREHQVKLSRDQHARELAEARAYEMFQLKLSLAADEARRQEAARELEAKRVLVKRQVRSCAVGCSACTTNHAHAAALHIL